MNWNRRNRPATTAPSPQLGLFQAPGEHPLLEALDGIDPDNMTPKQAQQALYALKELARQDLHS